MRRVILLASAGMLIVSYTGCAKYYARRYAPAYYDAAPCGCDGPVGPIGGVVVPGPAVVSPQAVGVMPTPVSKTISSTPIHGGAGY
jgi:hypothetical protein